MFDWVVISLDVAPEDTTDDCWLTSTLESIPSLENDIVVSLFEDAISAICVFKLDT